MSQVTSYSDKVRPTAGSTTVEVNSVTVNNPGLSGATLSLANGSTLETVGAFGITLTASGVTSLSLPTTGTLITATSSGTLTNKTLIDSSTTISDGATKAFKFNVNALVVNPTTIRIPGVGSGDDVLLCQSTTQDVENKSFRDVSNYFVSNGDISKKFKFDVSNVSAGVTRTMTVLNVDDTMVGLTATQTLTNKTLNSPTIATASMTSPTITNSIIISGAATLVLPTTSDVLVGRATIDTLTNKTFDDATTAIQDSGDNTKKIKFDASTLTTGITCTLTVPNVTSGTVVTATATQTLTNKTLTATSVTFADNVDSTKKVQFDVSSVTTATTRVLSVPDYDMTILQDGIYGFSTTDQIINTSTSLTSDVYFRDLTISGASTRLTTAGYRIFCSGTLTIGGSCFISHNGNNGSGATGGAALVAGSLGGSTAGGSGASSTGSVLANGVAGGNGTAGTQMGGNGGSGGVVTGGTAAVGGTTNGPTAVNGGFGTGTPFNSVSVTTFLNNINLVLGMRNLAGTQMTFGRGGGGGGALSNSQAFGGGGGGGGGCVMIFAKYINNGGQIQALGGTGGNSVNTPNGANGGVAGGGGGGGGVVFICYNEAVGSGLGTVSVNGGGVGAGAGTVTVAPVSGSNGFTKIVQI